MAKQLLLVSFVAEFVSKQGHPLREGVAAHCQAAGYHLTGRFLTRQSFSKAIDVQPTHLTAQLLGNDWNRVNELWGEVVLEEPELDRILCICKNRLHHNPVTMINVN